MFDRIQHIHYPNVQKVLPAVYGDELSYYELLAKFEDKINNLITLANELGVDVAWAVEAVKNIADLPEIDAQVKALQETANEIQATLEALPSYAEFTDLSQRVDSNTEKIDNNTENKVPFPSYPYSKYGTDGQVLRTNGNGSTQWQDPITPTDAQVETYINSWLNAHPEATTTVQDGSLTTPKYANDSITDDKLVSIGGIRESIGNTPVEYQGLLLSSGAWTNRADNFTILIKVRGGEHVKITAGEVKTAVYGVGTFTLPPYQGETFTYSDISPWDATIVVAANTTFEGTIPNDVEYISFFRRIMGDFAYPISVEIDGYEYRDSIIDNIRSIDESTNEAIDALSDEVSTEVSGFDTKIMAESGVTGKYLPFSVPYGSNNRAVDINGNIVSTSTRFRVFSDIDVSGYEYITYPLLHHPSPNSPQVLSLAFYSDYDYTTLVQGVPCVYEAGVTPYATQEIINVPEGAVTARVTSFFGEKPLFTPYILASITGIRRNVLNGKYLSVLTDSMGACTSQYVPEGNDIYYKMNNAEINASTEIWWMRLCNALGMNPLVIDAWSGSTVSYNVRSSGKVPMCSDLRTQRLGTVEHNPDVIIFSGGTNDFHFYSAGKTPLGTFDRNTVVDRNSVLAGTATFAESYASTIIELKQNYPNALIICASLYFCSFDYPDVRSMGGYAAADVNDVIKDVCKYLGVCYVDLYSMGFNEHNYGDYAKDSTINPVHLNWKGQAMLAKRYIDKLPKLAYSYFN